MSPYNFKPLTRSHDRRAIRTKRIADKHIKPEQFRALLRRIKKNPLSPSNRDRDYIAFAIMGNLGLRVGECAILRVADLELKLDSKHDMPFAEVRALKKKSKTATKVIYFHPKVAEAIADYIKKAGLSLKEFMFPGWSTGYGAEGHMSSRQLAKVFAEYCRACGFKENYSSHSMRHMYGTRLWERTQDAVFVRDQMGHAAVEGFGATNDYMHMSQKRINGLVNKVGYIL